MLKKKELLAFAKDRLAISLLIGFVFLLLVLIVMTVVTVRPSDVQVPARYSGYGVTNIYRDAWWALASFIPFALLVGGTNSYIAVKVHALRRGLAVGLLGMSVFVAVVALVVAGAVFRLASAVL